MNTAMQVFETAKPIESMLRSRDVMAKFADALGMENVQPFLASVVLAVMKKPDLMRCDPQSIFFAALDAAMLRLSLDEHLGHAYLVPFQGKATMIVGYKGIKQLAIRTGLYRVLNCAPIFPGMKVQENRLTGEVEIVGEPADYSQVIARVAHFEMVDGYKKSLAMTRQEIHEHARKHSKSYNNPSSPWRDPRFVGAMEATTPFRLLMERDGYLNPFEIQMARREDALPPAPPHLEDHKWGGEIVEGDCHGGSTRLAMTETGGPSVASDGVMPPPRSAKEIRSWLVGAAGMLAMKGKTEARASERALVAKCLNECFAPDVNAGQKRNEVSKWLTGYATVERMPGTTVLALGTWLVARDAEGNPHLCDAARQEAQRVWREKVNHE